MPRILVIVPFALDADGVRRRQAQLSAVQLAPDSTFVFRPVKAGPSSFMSPHDFALMDVAIFEAGVTAEEDGFDAVCIDTMSDSGMAALRSVLDIPVVSPGRASMLFALTLGSKFSVLAQWDPALYRYRHAVREYGLSAQCASVRSFGIPPDFDALLGGKKETAFPKMLETCMACIEEDGAEVICLGSTTMHEAAAWLAERLPVPLINPGPLTYKLVETMLALGLTHSRAAYPRPVSPELGLLHAMMDGARAYADGSKA
ncbi:MAG: hydrogenase expression protein HupH [Rhodobacteraceae bacterium]|nr:hydrogenase expression protein HupH [Paracoccaceae bacterium]